MYERSQNLGRVLIYTHSAPIRRMPERWDFAGNLLWQLSSQNLNLDWSYDSSHRAETVLFLHPSKLGYRT